MTTQSLPRQMKRESLMPVVVPTPLEALKAGKRSALGKLP